jgi:hypothetical protein
MKILKPFIFCWSWLTKPLFRNDTNYRRWGERTENIHSRCAVCGIRINDSGNSIYPPDWRWGFCPRHPEPKLGFGSFPAFEEAGMERHFSE